MTVADEASRGMTVDLSRTLASVRPVSYRPPVLGPSVVPRPAVVDRLCFAAPGSLVSICAPAGYGKTTTAALWARAETRPVAWLSLGMLDNDPSHLVAHLANALADRGLIERDEVRYLSGPGRSPLADLVPAVAGMLEQVEPFVVVADDVHALTDPDAIAVLGALVDARPTNSVVALLSRHPLRGTARRRLSDGLLELGPADLALGIDEARVAFHGLGVAITDDELAGLVEHCEGWPGGLHLAALARRDRPGEWHTISGRNRLLAEYLVEEVLEGLEPALVAFLEEASLVSPMSAELLDVLLDLEESGLRLAELEASGNLFLVALDDEGELYRFHHLFQELLDSRLQRRDPARWRAIHERAVDVLVERGEVDLAVTHAVRAGDHRRAAALVQRDAVALAMSGRGGVLHRRLELLDRQAGPDANTAMAGAWAAVTDGDVRAVRERLTTARDCDEGGPLADGSASTATAIALMTSLIGEGGPSSVIDTVTTAVDADDRWSPTARTIRATALIQVGRFAEARLDLDVALSASQVLPAFEAASLELLAWLHLRDGDVANAVQSSRAGREVLVHHDLRAVVPVLVGWSCDAVVAARSGERDRALDDVATAEELLLRLGPEPARTHVFNHQLLAEAHHVLGQGAEARRHLGEADRQLRHNPMSDWFEQESARLADLISRGPGGTMLSVTPLTGAERRLLPYLATHLSLPQIAGELHVSRNTVKTHCVSIYRKLGVASRSDAVAEARRLGLIAA
jgi:LuxR family maltose regulon positive regulatory protein